MGDESLFAGWPDRIRCESWLVVSATTQAAALQRVLEAFRKTEPSALVLTKLDEAEQLGETLSVLLDQHLGLTFVSDGQRIAEDFHRVETGDLTRRALGEEERPARGASRDERWTDQTLAELAGTRSHVASARGTPDGGALEMIHPVGKGRYATH